MMNIHENMGHLLAFLNTGLQTTSPPSTSTTSTTSSDCTTFASSQSILQISVREPTSNDLVRSLTQLSICRDEEPTSTRTACCDHPLSSDELNQLYARLPPISHTTTTTSTGATSASDMLYHQRETTILPERSGSVIQQPFPPTSTPTAAAPSESDDEDRMVDDEVGGDNIKNELRVVRYAPQGLIQDTVNTPCITVTFSHDMIALSDAKHMIIPYDYSNKSNDIEYPFQIDVDQLQKDSTAATAVNLKGRFRWLGTRTVTFEAQYQLPKSTRFIISIPQGKQSAVISSHVVGSLSTAVSFTIETPTVQLIDQFPLPNSVHPLNELPIGYLEFDQQVDASTVLDHYVSCKGVQFQLLTRDQVKQQLNQIFSAASNGKLLAQRYQSSYETKLLSSTDKESRHLWFKMQSMATNNVSFISGDRLTIQVGPNLPSKEGPLTNSTKKFDIPMQNYPPFQVKPNTEQSNLLPLQAWSIRFSNDIDLESLSDDMISVDPPLPHIKLNPSGNTLSISGRSKGRTLYTVSVFHRLKDIYGQLLQVTPQMTNTTDETTQEKWTQVTFNVGPAAQLLSVFQTNLVILDPMIATHEPPQHSVVTVNLSSFHLMVSQVDPSMYKSTVFYPDHGKENQLPTLPGTVVFSGDITVESPQPDEPTETVINLLSYLQFPRERLGQLLIAVTPTKGTWKKHSIYYSTTPPCHITWIQATNMAIDCFSTSNSKKICWANSLIDGSSVQGAKFSYQGIESEETDENGVVEMKAKVSSYELPLVCRKGDDIVFVTGVNDAFNYTDSIAMHMFTDRGLYKPKETIYVKGFARELIRTNKGSTYKLKNPTVGHSLSYTIRDGRYQQIATGNAKITGCGAFTIQYTLPDNINLGSCRIEVRYSALYASVCAFKVLEFRTPEYSVASNVPPLHYLVNDSAVVTMNAVYYSGGGLNDASVDYTISQANSTYTPPGWSKFKFQYSPPFWSIYHLFMRELAGNEAKQQVSPVSFSGKTDADGQHQVCIQFKETARKVKQPVTISCETSVQDINRQTINSSASFIIHPSNFYVGVRTKKQFVRPNVNYDMDLIVTNIDGKPRSNVSIVLTATTTERVKHGYLYMENEVEVFRSIIVSQLQPVSHTVQFHKGGNYTLTFQVEDQNGLHNSTAVDVSVYGGDSLDSSTSAVTSETITIIPDKDSYQPGEEAKLFVQVPFEGPAECFYFVECSGIMFKQRFSIGAGVSCAELTIPICDEYTPNVTIGVYVVGQSDRVNQTGRIVKPSTSDENAVPKRPAYAVGSLCLNIPPTRHEIKCQVIPKSSSVTPGETTEVEVRVTDVNGKPLNNSEVTLVVVDEAVLSLIGYSIQVPLSTFYVRNNNNMIHIPSRRLVLVKNWDNIQVEEEKDEDDGDEDEDECEGGMQLYSSGGKAARRVGSDRTWLGMHMSQPKTAGLSTGGSAGVKPLIVARSNFNPLALFAPVVFTDQNGVAKTSFTLPDSLTRYRVTAVAVHSADMFGLGDSSIVAQLPVSIRPSLPRFLNFGDEAQFSCVLQNQTNRPIEMHVAIQYSNHLSLKCPEKTGLKIKMPAMGRTELSYPMKAESTGEACFQIGATTVSGTTFCDAVEKKVPVYTPATSEAFATSSEIDGVNEGVYQPILPPSDAYSQFGGLQITTSSTALQSLTDAFIYLVDYQFSCNEQIASKIMSIVTLGEVLSAFNIAALPSVDKLQDMVERGLEELYKNQHSSGAFGFWKSELEVSAYVTVHVAHCFARCIMAGRPVTNDSLLRSKTALRTIENFMKEAYYTKESKRAVRSYAYYVLSLLGDEQAVPLTLKLWKECGGITRGLSKSSLSMEGLAWVAFVLFNNKKKNTGENKAIVDTIFKHLMNRVNETAETANFVTSYGDNQTRKLVMLHSSRRTDAVILDVLMSVDPTNSLVVKVAKGLLAHRKKGCWSSTQENIFCLIALHKYFGIYEAKIPNFTLDMWIDRQYAGHQEYVGRSTDQNLLNIPMKHLLAEQEQQLSSHNNLVMHKKGDGRMYYRIGLTYAPKNLSVDALDCGFTVERTYEPVTDQSHVKKNDQDGSWEFKAGELVRVRITLCNPSRRYHVALVDKLPAGLEILNPDLKTTGTITADSRPSQDNEGSARSGGDFCWWWKYVWYEHQNLRDERVEAFSSLLWEGAHKYSYICRATSIGDFVVPPAYAEEMYSPEVFGRSATDKVRVH